MVDTSAPGAVLERDAQSSSPETASPSQDPRRARSLALLGFESPVDRGESQRTLSDIKQFGSQPVDYPNILDGRQDTVRSDLPFYHSSRPTEVRDPRSQRSSQRERSSIDISIPGTVGTERDYSLSVVDPAIVEQQRLQAEAAQREAQLQLARQQEEQRKIQEAQQHQVMLLSIIRAEPVDFEMYQLVDGETGNAYMENISDTFSRVKGYEISEKLSDIERAEIAHDLKHVVSSLLMSNAFNEEDIQWAQGIIDRINSGDINPETLKEVQYVLTEKTVATDRGEYEGYLSALQEEAPQLFRWKTDLTTFKDKIESYFEQLVPSISQILGLNGASVAFGSISYNSQYWGVAGASPEMRAVTYYISLETLAENFKLSEEKKNSIHEKLIEAIRNLGEARRAEKEEKEEQQVEQEVQEQKQVGNEFESYVVDPLENALTMDIKAEIQKLDIPAPMKGEALDILTGLSPIGYDQAYASRVSEELRDTVNERESERQVTLKTRASTESQERTQA
jgi:hypothetical protein